MRHVYRNAVVDWFVADSAAHAAILWRAYMRDAIGETDLDIYEDDGAGDFRQCRDEEMLLLVEEEADGAEAVGKTCREWADEKDEGFLGSTEF